jgi:hypothetical protein
MSANLEAAVLMAGTLLLAGCQSASLADSKTGNSKAAKPAWVYHGGTFYWPGDYSSNATPYYTDKSGEPVGGGRDIKVVLQGKWGLFQPYATNWDFDTKPYAYFTFSIKPTLPDQALQIYFMQVGDKPVGNVVNPFKYGPAPEVGKWTAYRIPLEDLGVDHIHVYKFAIQDQTGRGENTFYLDDVGFLPAE